MTAVAILSAQEARRHRRETRANRGPVAVDELYAEARAHLDAGDRAGYEISVALARLAEALGRERAWALR